MTDGDGVMMVIDEDTKKIRYFSRSLMCPDTGIAYKNPEPNFFSFNSPKGACQSCNGLGTFRKVDIDKIVPNKDLSINNGAIVPIANRKSDWLINQIKLIAKKYNFSMNIPFFDIPQDAKDAIFYGIKDTMKVKLKLAGISKTYKLDFYGIVNFIEEQSQLSSVKSPPH